MSEAACAPVCATDPNFRLTPSGVAYNIDPVPTGKAEPARLIGAGVPAARHVPAAQQAGLVEDDLPRLQRPQREQHALERTSTARQPGTPVPNGNHPAMDLAGNGATFTDAELLQVQDIYQRVAEDYAPFDVDVTTEEPPAADIDRANAGDNVYGTRALISPSTTRIEHHLQWRLRRRRVHRRLRPPHRQGRVRRDAQSAPAGLGVPAGAGQRRQEHRRGHHPRGGPQPRPRPRRHQLRWATTPATTRGRRSWASPTTGRSGSSR